MVDPILIISIFVAIIAHIAIYLWLSRKSVPSPIISTNPLGNNVKVTETSKEESRNETVSSKSLITFSSMPVAKTVLNTHQTNNNDQPKNEQMVATTTESIKSSSFTVPKISTSPNKTIVSLSTVSSSTENSPRLGGFAFSATQIASKSSSNGMNPISKSQTTQSDSLFTSSAPMFLFGASKSSSDSNDLAESTFNFGSTKVDEPAKSMPTLSNTSLSSSVPVVDSNSTFNLGSSIRKTVQPDLNQVTSTLPTTNNMSTVMQSAPVTSASVGFSFGNSTLFGSGKGSGIPLPTFGSVTNANNSTPQFGSNLQSTFGGNQLATAITSASVFGNNNASASTKTGGKFIKTSLSTGQSNTFGMSSNPSTSDESTSNIFGAIGSSATPNPNVFHFIAGPQQQQQQKASTNMFSIVSSMPPTTKTGRPMRMATRRIK